METEAITGGAFQVARKIFESELWLDKPSSWKVIWIYIVGNVNHIKNGKFERGEGFFNLTKELRLIGNDISLDSVKKFCEYARKCSMISTKRSTRGVIIKVLHYNKYQTLGNYTRTTMGTKQSTSRALSKHYDKQEWKNGRIRPLKEEIPQDEYEAEEKRRKDLLAQSDLIAKKFTSFTHPIKK